MKRAHCLSNVFALKSSLFSAMVIFWCLSLLWSVISSVATRTNDFTLSFCYSLLPHNLSMRLNREVCLFFSVFSKGKDTSVRLKEFRRNTSVVTKVHLSNRSKLNQWHTGFINWYDQCSSTINEWYISVMCTSLHKAEQRSEMCYTNTWYYISGTSERIKRQFRDSVFVIVYDRLAASMLALFS